MKPEEIIAIIAIVLIVGGAILYIVKAKKSGKRCIGCPDGGSCGGACSGNCGSCCGCATEGHKTSDNEATVEQSEGCLAYEGEATEEGGDGESKKPEGCCQSEERPEG